MLARRLTLCQFRPHFSVDPATGQYSVAIRSPTGLPTDPPLTSYGVEQSHDLAVHLLGIEPPVDAVYSSPYYRCLQTIAPYVARRREASRDALGMRVEAGVGEWYGLAPWEHPTSAPLDRLKDLFPDIDAGYASQVTPPRVGETLCQLHDRVAAAIEAIIHRSDREGARSVVICTHAAVVIALGRVLTGRMPSQVDDEDFGAFTCGLSVYRRRRVDASQATGLRPVSEPVPEEGPVEGRGSPATMQHLPGEEVVPGTVGVDQPQAPSSSTETPGWRGQGVYGGWQCEANSDCSFLRGGEERGW